MRILDLTDYTEQLVVCGDIHAQFVGLCDAIERAGLTNAAVIVAGDCGFGFYPLPYYEKNYCEQLDKRLERANVTLLMMRGNHDNPEFFSKQMIDFPRMKTLPDYSVISTGKHKVLCVGGAISIDRTNRLGKMQLQRLYYGEAAPIYWPDEPFVYDEDELNRLEADKLRIDTVVTHTAPAFCEPLVKKGLLEWAEEDAALLSDVEKERRDVSRLYEWLMAKGHPLKQWFYGHFHYAATAVIDATTFRMLGIMELSKVR